MADGSHGSAVHGVAGSPVLLKGASSNGTMSTGTLPSSVTANISSVSVIVPATPPGGESIFLHVVMIVPTSLSGPLTGVLLFETQDLLCLSRGLQLRQER